MCVCGASGERGGGGGGWIGGENSINDSCCFLKREVAFFKGRAISERLVLFCLDDW